MRLVIGPTCGGKSTYIERLKTDAAQRGERLEVRYAFELSREGGPVPGGPLDVVHMNLLKGYKKGVPRISVKNNALVPRLIEAADEVAVLTAPRGVLEARATGRSMMEPGDERYEDVPYDADGWGMVLDNPHLAQVYEQLALHLDGAGVPHRYLCSHDEGHEAFQQISRWEFPRLAEADAEERCRAGHPLLVPDLGRTYQSDYHEGASGSKRSATIGRILQMPLAGKELLDIGCAEGAVALSAARMGARVTGLEPRAARLEKARALAAATGTDLTLHRTELEDFPSPAGAFDVVLALNLLHHVLDPFAVLDRAADLTSSHLVLEYPGLDDPKFRRTFSGASPASTLPFIGVSTPIRDQTFVFSPVGLERYLVEHLRAFEHHELVRSPMAERWISVFSGKRPRSRLRSTTAARLRLERQNAELRRRNGELRRRVEALEASRSWKVTAPLRRLSERLR